MSWNYRIQRGCTLFCTWLYSLTPITTFLIIQFHPLHLHLYATIRPLSLFCCGHSAPCAAGSSPLFWSLTLFPLTFTSLCCQLPWQHWISMWTTWSILFCMLMLKQLFTALPFPEPSVLHTARTKPKLACYLFLAIGDLSKVSQSIIGLLTAFPSSVTPY